MAAAARRLGVDQTTVARRLRALDEAYEGRLCLRYGAPEQIVTEVARDRKSVV